ncbi:MAG TPA: BMP family ABC transporter substrate-binding protein [Acholeplasmataceae bacterium]|nr:BMP family ABC transporter substrate-binding protein [Acholeplasmataceae bacterium]
MKKILLFILIVLSFFVLDGCKRDKYTIALITDVGDIDDKSFNQGAWEGVLMYAEGKDVTYEYYKPTDQGTDEYLAAIDLAISNGAEIIITPGYLFEDTINIAQKQYPNVKFVLLDGSPEFVEGGTIEENTYSVLYAEEQSGYLAGYAIVKEGYRDLAFMGGMAVPPVVRFGYGFVLGADAAAQELDVNVNIKYGYVETFKEGPEVKSTAVALYNQGVEVVFACGGSIGQSVMSAASDANAKVIGVDVDQSSDSPTVITSAMKGLRESVAMALEAYFNGKWDTVGGKSVVLDASQNGVGLPMDTSRFENFTEEEYNALFKKMADGEIEINVDVDSFNDLDVVNTTISGY